jgi:hypothetical protein
VNAGELRERLIGAWKLVSYEAHALDTDDVVHPLGRSPEGMILYTPDGFMSAQLMAPDRPPYLGNDAHRAADGEFAAAAAGYTGYAGPFEVLEDGRTIVHHVAVALMPNWVGVPQYRVARLEDDRIELSLGKPMMIEGRLRDARLVWRRAVTPRAR